MDTVRKVQKWATTASNSIDSEDAKLVEQVYSGVLLITYLVLTFHCNFKTYQSENQNQIHFFLVLLFTC